MPKLTRSCSRKLAKHEMNPKLLHLIQRMCQQEMPIPGLDSTTTESWKAYREAETIDREDYIPQLIESIGDVKNARMRDAMYFLLGKIARRTKNTTGLAFMIGKVTVETNKRLVLSLLERIAEIEKPQGTELQPLLAAIKSEAPSIRHSAIDSLQHSVDPQAERVLLDILAHSNDALDLIYSNATLGSIGTLCAIPALTKCLDSKKRDVRDSAKFAIAKIQERFFHQNGNL